MAVQSEEVSWYQLVNAILTLISCVLAIITCGRPDKDSVSKVSKETAQKRRSGTEGRRPSTQKKRAHELNYLPFVLPAHLKTPQEKTRTPSPSESTVMKTVSIMADTARQSKIVPPADKEDSRMQLSTAFIDQQASVAKSVLFQTAKEQKPTQVETSTAYQMTTSTAVLRKKSKDMDDDDETEEDQAPEKKNRRIFHVLPIGFDVFSPTVIFLLNFAPMDVETKRREGEWESGDVGFDLREVARLFRCCRRQDGSIALWQYLLAYNELNKFFLVLGRIFYFVHSEVSDKTRILAEHLSSECGVHYESVQSMLEYELRLGVVDQEALAGRPSGARTLLRLHRALQFVSRFIDSVSSSDCDHLALLARTAYDETLAKHHTWLVRKGVHLAVYTLPSRKQLLYRICATMGHSEIEESLRQLVVECEEVFQNVQTLYANRGLLDLA